MVDIEELRGLEFHYESQGNELVEQLGISLQQLGRKAFPSMSGKEFDRLLKERFLQVLGVKWQRKLGAPKPDETCMVVLESWSRERNSILLVLTRYRLVIRKLVKDKAVNASRAGEGTGRSPPLDNSQTYPSSEVAVRRCYKCQETDHIAQNCLQHTEAPGRQSSHNNAVESIQSVPSASKAVGTASSQ